MRYGEGANVAPFSLVNGLTIHGSRRATSKLRGYSAREIFAESNSEVSPRHTAVQGEKQAANPDHPPRRGQRSAGMIACSSDNSYRCIYT